MEATLTPNSLVNQPTAYEIRVQGHLDRRWDDWFEGLTITLADTGDTLITGLVADQAALHGLLKKVRDLGVPLLSVNPVKPDLPTTAKTEPSVPLREQK